MTDSIKIKNTFLNFTLFIFGLLILFIAYNIYLSLQISQDENLEDKQSTGGIIQVSVLNGTQTDGLSKKLSDYLRTMNFDVVIQGNYSTRDVRKTFIIDHLGDKKVLQRVVRVLKIDPNQVKRDKKEFELTDITIVIGEDYQKLNSEIKW